MTGMTLGIARVTDEDRLRDRDRRHGVQVVVHGEPEACHAGSNRKIDVQNADATQTRIGAAAALTSSGVRPAVDQRAFGVLSGRYMRPAMAPPLTESTSPVT
jgi:hypothetical protein